MTQLWVPTSTPEEGSWSAVGGGSNLECVAQLKDSYDDSKYSSSDGSTELHVAFEKIDNTNQPELGVTIYVVAREVLGGTLYIALCNGAGGEIEAGTSGLSDTFGEVSLAISAETSKTLMESNDWRVKLYITVPDRDTVCDIAAVNIETPDRVLRGYSFG